MLDQKSAKTNLKAAMFMDILWQKFYRIPVLNKIKFGKQL